MHNTFSAFDYAMMARALRLAKRGIYTAAPNPMVGCVITLDGEIIGEGHHQQAGTAHAEVNALLQVNELIAQGKLVATQLKEATAYVTKPLTSSPSNKRTVASSTKRPQPS